MPCHPHATLIPSWYVVPLVYGSDLFDLAGIVLPSGTTCQLSNIQTYKPGRALSPSSPPPPPPALGRGGEEGESARPGLGGLRPPRL